METVMIRTIEAIEDALRTGTLEHISFALG